jgi:hypothetical protein
VQRLLQQQSEVIGEALTYLPDCLLPFAEFDLFCADPIFAGVCTSDWDKVTSLTTGRSYRSTMHVRFPYHIRDRRTTICAPAQLDLATALHEIGHVIEWRVRERSNELPALTPVSEYAGTNWSEMFAEAFTQWFYPRRQVEASSYWTHWDRGNCEFFERLGAA